MNKKKYSSFSIIASSVAIIFITYYLYTKYESNKIIPLLGAVITAINLLRLKYAKKIENLASIILDFRWLVALIVFVVCVSLKLHGSSVSFYDSQFSGKIDETETGLLLGSPRELRGDEYNVQLPFYFSQKYNDFQKTSYQMSLGGQDMILGYNAPVKDITMIGKPFTWGYLFLGNEYGLSWYWCMKTILFLLVSYEACVLLTRKKSISILGAILIVFSPSMQWWFSPHMYDVFFWATSLLVIGYHYFTAKGNKMKLLFTMIAPCAVIGFILGLFPSCQIPLGLIAIALLIVLLIRDRDKITFTLKDIWRILLDVFIVCGVVGYFLITSKDDITLLYSTVYPGKRISTGGDFAISDLFTDLTNIKIPFKQSIILNNCEVSTFNHLGVLFLLYFPVLYRKMKKANDKERIIGVVFFAILMIEIIFMIIGFPEWLAKITLFSYINRMKIVYGFTATLFTIWNISILFRNKNYIQKKLAILVLALFAALYVLVTPESSFDYFKINSLTIYLYIEIFLFTLIGLFIFSRNKEFTMVGFLSFAVISACTVNPIAIGTPALYNHEISILTAGLIEENNGYWLCANSSYDQNFFLANGAKVINAVNFYPDYEKWDIIDPEHKNEDAYNRYAHMRINLIDETETQFKMVAPDSIEVNLSITDLKKWNISYVTSRVDYTDLFKRNQLNFTLLYHNEEDMTYVYSLT